MSRVKMNILDGVRSLTRFLTSVAATATIASAGSTHAAPPQATPATPLAATISLQSAQNATLKSPQLASQPIAQLQPQTLALLPTWSLIPLTLVGGVFAIAFCSGLVIIGEREVGIVVKKFSLAGKALPAGRLIALNGEAGYQADTLAPGWHWFYWSWQYSVRKEPMVVVPQGEIALLVANDGASIPPERILGKVTECDNFQDARKFLTQGGERGRQMGFLTAGTYRINTALFKVITTETASKHGMKPEHLQVYTVQSDKVGIVTTLDGVPIQEGEIAGATIAGHDNFQNGQKFITAGGRRGLQEQILLSGSWNFNPWFVQVEQVPMTEIPIGYVGVVISFVGTAQEDVSGAAFTHGNLVQPGHKGVWVEPLYPC
ncbi:MAG: band 7 protein, partial [Leptolyngbya sp. ERB_1_2]